MTRETIRNFVIISHVDHGKSTLADRFLELTGTVDARKMRPQYLDRLELERERGITIKMAPVRMAYTVDRTSYLLNLIDTPGHSDFSYEVSRALAAVEGAVLLVDAAKGIQAQTLANFRAASRAGLTVIGAVNKIDLFPARQGAAHPRVLSAVRGLASLIQVPEEDILLISGKTGEGVSRVLDAVIRRVPPPVVDGAGGGRALIFDSLYDSHRGILAFVRVFGGEWKRGHAARLLAAGVSMKLKEVGSFAPELAALPALMPGEIGYLATGLKEPDVIRIGDTVVNAGGGERAPALPGYREPSPVVFMSFYPDGDSQFDDLAHAFAKLRLNDPALTLEPESNDALGRGIKVGFLGQLHAEIAASRLKDEFGVLFLTSFPSVAFRVREGSREYVVKQASEFPAKPDAVWEPMIRTEIIVPAASFRSVLRLARPFHLAVEETKSVGEQVFLAGRMPLAELLANFDDELKSVSEGYASLSYELAGEAPARVAKLEILVAGELVPAMTRIVSEENVAREARVMADRLKTLLPREQFAQAIQARAGGRIIARETIPALKKDVTGYLYGGDRSRKKKLWQKQKRGKEKLKRMAKVRVPVEVFRKILKRTP
ncbi:MAG: elongation factor 4 [Candidatus Liptonbacteria bacterium]|nr:elongation factor 4 [Candidatus Liptonbacteria bacterium]